MAPSKARLAIAPITMPTIVLPEMVDVLSELEASDARDPLGNALSVFDYEASQLGGFLAGVSAVSV